MVLQKNKNRKLASRKKLWIVAGLAVVLIGVGVFAFVSSKDNNESDKTAQAASTKLENKLGKQKTDEKGDSNKTQSSTKQSTGDTLAGSGTKPTGSTVTPVITYFGNGDSGQVEVDAFVPGIFESGTCTLTITSGSTKITSLSKPAQPNAQSTRCENFLVDGTGASSSWRAVVNYSSVTHSGTSSAAAFQN